MPKNRRVFKGLTSYAYPTKEKLEYFLDAIDDEVDADSILGSDPHFQKNLKEWIDKNRKNDFFYDFT